MEDNTDNKEFTHQQSGKIFIGSERVGPLFCKIKANNLYNILHFLDYFTLTEVFFVNQKFKEITSKKYIKKIIMIITSVKVYKMHIKLQFNQDLRCLLRENSIQVRKNIKPLIMGLISEYFYKLPVMKFYFTRMKNKTIRHIDLSKSCIGKKSIKYLSYYIENNATVGVINISGNKLTGCVLDPLVEIIPTAVGLKHIKMNQCFIDNKTLRNISKIYNASAVLTRLSLRQCNIESEMLGYLKCGNVEYLNLYGNNLNCDNVLHICQAFPKLKKLNLGKNILADIAMLYITMFIKNQTCGLLHLNLEENYITVSGMLILLIMMSSLGEKSTLKYLNISKNMIQKIPSRITKMTVHGLEELYIGGNNFLQEDVSNVMEFVNENPSIVEADFRGNIFDNMIIRQIFKKIAGNASIRKLGLSSCYLVNTDETDMLIEYLEGDGEDCRLRKISMIDLSYNNLNYTNFAKVVNLNVLEYINLEHNDINLWGDYFQTFCIAVAECKVLKYLNLNHNFLKLKAVTLFTILSQREHALTEIHLQNNQISEVETIHAVRQLLLNTNTLIILDLKNNEISDKEFIDEEFFMALTVTKTFELNLDDNKISIQALIYYLDYLNSQRMKMKMKSSAGNCTLTVRSKLIREGFDNEDIRNQFREKFLNFDYSKFSISAV